MINPCWSKEDLMKKLARKVKGQGHKVQKQVSTNMKNTLWFITAESFVAETPD